MMKKIEWVLCSMISFCALISSLSSKATHQKLKLTSQNKGLSNFLDTSPKRYASGFVVWWFSPMNSPIKFEFSAMNLQPNGFFLQKCGTLTKGININVGRKTNMSRAHAQAHKKQVTSSTSSQNKKGSIRDFVLRRDVFCSVRTRNLHSGACLPCEVAS